MSAKCDVSIIIVHTFEKNLVRQTLKGIRRSAPELQFEIIIVDNNPPAGVKEVIDDLFPEAVYIPLSKNKGFGGGMNEGIRRAKGEYVLIFNPDIIIQPGSLETLKTYMDEHPEVGVCGPKLLNPDGSLQYSCFRQPTSFIPAYRRTPLGLLPVGKRAVDAHLMKDFDHEDTIEVDSLIGAALFTRHDALKDVGLFDERFFMYYEDNDLCRRFWEKGYKVVYHPRAEMVHYHRRASADGNLFNQLTSRFTWIHISSAMKYFWKYRNATNPRLTKTS